MLRRFLATFATPGLLIGLLLVMASFYAADQFLAGLERREIAAEAQRVAAAGALLLQRGRNAEAIDAFRRAHVIERGNREYRLSLADALIRDGRPGNAVSVLDDVLAEDSNDGMANLLMARAMARQKRFPSADSYYHRAIYGSWLPGQLGQSIQARLELVRQLAQRGDKQSLLAELIPLEQRAKSEPPIARELPALYLQAGALPQAEESYRALIRDPGDKSEAYAGLARVELQKGNFYAAELNFHAALATRPNDPALVKEADLARFAHDLDPTSRRLPSAEKLARSQRILTIAVGVVQGCSADAASLDFATKLLTVKPPKSANNEMAEARLDAATKIWNSRPPSCKSVPDEADVLALLIRKIQQ